MYERSIGKPTNNHTSSYTDLITMAERELAAFVGAVTELFGPEEASLSAEEWVHALVPMRTLCRSTSRGLRAVTIATSVRLVTRLNAALHPIESILPPDLNCYYKKSKNDQQNSLKDLVETVQGEESWRLQL